MGGFAPEALQRQSLVGCQKGLFLYDTIGYEIGVGIIQEGRSACAQVLEVLGEHTPFTWIMVGLI